MEYTLARLLRFVDREDTEQTAVRCVVCGRTDYVYTQSQKEEEAEKAAPCLDCKRTGCRVEVRKHHSTLVLCA
jgi:hypothetical protein